MHHFGSTLLSLIVLCACGAAERPSAPSGDAPPALAPLGAALFEEGRVWRYTIESSTESYMPDDPRAESDGTVRGSGTEPATCRVAEGGAVAVGRWTRIECDPGIELLSGVWVSAPSGLYHLGDVAAPDAITSLPDDRRVLPAEPGEHTEDRFDPERAAEPIGSITIHRDGDAWCRELLDTQGDASWERLCLSPRGIERGSYGSDGASTSDTSFTLERSIEVRSAP